MVRKTATPEEKVKAAEYQRQWREANPERWKAIAGPSRKKWKKGNRDEHREAQRNHRYTLRREMLDLLGGQKCVHCGYDADWRALQMDHINGGGMADRRTHGGILNMWAMRNWIIKNPEEARIKYQVLCANCNWIKRHERGEHAGGVVTKDAL